MYKKESDGYKGGFDWHRRFNLLAVWQAIADNCLYGIAESRNGMHFPTFLSFVCGLDLVNCDWDAGSHGLCAPPTVHHQSCYAIWPIRNSELLFPAA